MGQIALARHSQAEDSASRGTWSARTIALAAADAFAGITAAVGAVFVVPTLPDDLYRYAVLHGPVGPTAGLGLVAAIALVALYGVVTRKRFGAALSIVGGAALVLFELVESLAVGSLFTPPVGVPVAGYVGLWLQPFYIGVGLAMVVLGGRFGFIRFASGPTAIGLVVLTVFAGSAYGWAAASTGTSMYARFIAWGDSTTYDWTRFPSRQLAASAQPDLFAQAPLQVDLARATGSAHPDQFFASNETTALLVIQHDQLVLERYFNGADRSTRIMSFSMTKSWNSAMVGAAIAAGYIHSVDDPVTAYIPELARKDPRFAAITLRNLLEQRSGLAWDTSGLVENDDSVTYNTTTLRQAVLDRVRVIAPAGSVFFYNDFNPLLVGMVLERATGRAVTQWLDQTLWQPLGMQYPGSFSIDSVAGGFEKMPSGLSGAPIDLIKLGVLYLHTGTWHGAQLVPSQWVVETTDPTTASEAMLGLSYTMGWWTRVIDGVRVYFAWGNHGEYVLVAPSLDIVVARFGRQYGLDAPRGSSGGGVAGHQIWPQVLTRVATTVAAARS